MNEAIVKEILNSNLTEETKTSILGAMSVYSNRCRIDMEDIHQDIINAFLKNNNKPMRVSELTAEGVLSNDYTVQRISARLRQMIANGLVSRFTIETGNIIDLGDIKIKEKLAYFQLIL